MMATVPFYLQWLVFGTADATMNIVDFYMSKKS